LPHCLLSGRTSILVRCWQFSQERQMKQISRGMSTYENWENGPILHSFGAVQVL
jgi:hypothetical protein